MSAAAGCGAAPSAARVGHVPPAGFSPARVISYGDHPSQSAEVWDGAGSRVALIHGGYWRQPWGCDMEHAVAADLVGRGFAVWNVEYRRMGGGGGWPATGEDVRAALRLARPDVVIGYSAGGQLALWAAAEGLTRRAVSQAGFNDLREAARRHLANDAVLELLGRPPEEVPEADPAQRDIDADLLLVHGDRDDEVPLALTTEWRGPGEQVVVAGEDHGAHVDPGSRSWQAVLAWM